MCPHIINYARFLGKQYAEGSNFAIQYQLINCITIGILWAGVIYKKIAESVF